MCNAVLCCPVHMSIGAVHLPIVHDMTDSAHTARCPPRTRFMASLAWSCEDSLQAVAAATAMLTPLAVVSAEVPMRDEQSWAMSWSTFQQLQPLEQLQFLIPAQLPDPAEAAATAQRAAKYLAAVHQPQARQQLLVQLVAQDPATHLPWLVHIFERLRLQQQVQCFKSASCPVLLTHTWLCISTSISTRPGSSYCCSSRHRLCRPPALCVAPF